MDNNLLKVIQIRSLWSKAHSFGIPLLKRMSHYTYYIIVLIQIIVCMSPQHVVIFRIVPKLFDVIPNEDNYILANYAPMNSTILNKVANAKFHVAS